LPQTVVHRPRWNPQGEASLAHHKLRATKATARQFMSGASGAGEDKFRSAKLMGNGQTSAPPVAPTSLAIDRANL